MTYRITVTLEPKEMDALRNLALREMRTPRDQASLFLRKVLGGKPPNPAQGKKNTTSERIATPNAGGENRN